MSFVAVKAIYRPLNEDYWLDEEGYYILDEDNNYMYE